MHCKMTGKIENNLNLDFVIINQIGETLGMNGKRKKERKNDERYKYELTLASTCEEPKTKITAHVDFKPKTYHTQNWHAIYLCYIDIVLILQCEHIASLE